MQEQIKKTNLKIAVLSPVAWRTPPEKYGPWEQVASNVAEGLIQLGAEVTLFATANSKISNHRLESVVPGGYEETEGADAKVYECLHIANLMEQAGKFDIIHNHFDFLPLTYSRLIDTPVVTTIHGFSSPEIVPVYEKYNQDVTYVSISDADRHPRLNYAATVYNGIRKEDFSYSASPGDYYLYFGRIHPDKGTHEAIRIARAAGIKLLIAGLIQDESYFDACVKPYLNHSTIVYLGNLGPVARNSLMGKARALLHPVQFEEPFGLSVVESMMCGTPVIAFRRGAMPELIRPGLNGFLVNDTDEAVEAVHQVENINRSVCRSHAVEHFSMEKMAASYLEVYQQVFRKSPLKLPGTFTGQPVKQVAELDSNHG